MSSCESLYRGMSYLQKQSDIATPTKVKVEKAEMPDDDDRFLGLSPEPAELWKSLGDTPDSKALKEEYLRTQGALKRGSVADPDLCSSFSSGSCGGSTTTETTQILPGGRVDHAVDASKKRPIEDDEHAGHSKRMKEERASLEKYIEEQMSKLRAQMQQELIQHQQALADARTQHEMALQAEQEKQEQQLMVQRAEHEASMQEEKDHHEHNLCLLIEQASAAKAEAERVPNPAPTPKDALCAPPKPDAHDVKAKLRAKMESQTPGPQTGQHALPKPSVAAPAPVAVATPTQQAPPPTTPHTQQAVQTNSPPGQTQLAVQTSSPPTQTQLAVQTINPAAQPPLQGIGSGPFNSSTHPAAWGALYRISKAPDCMPEIRQAWDAGEFQRQNLLRDFIGSYSWKTEAEMRKPPLEWEDLYDPNIRKFLVLVRDDVESAEEKLQELQQEMAQMGLLSSDFELGDIMEELEGESTTDQPKPPATKKRLAEYPAVEGEETIQEYLGQYRRAVLSRKALLKCARERLEKDGAKGHEPLAFMLILVACFTQAL
ncbi:unnamed protein product [Symbiodinium necroappetens]|uniref:Uncharacterized protein n=1 Tax=Symbiodinium necroappetens TaxID=1628268 RepID=A0A812RM18_9DINO|nr:unnamed protein product [Symbiodinium necroappetens]